MGRELSSESQRVESRQKRLRLCHSSKAGLPRESVFGLKNAREATGNMVISC